MGKLLFTLAISLFLIGAGYSQQDSVNIEFLTVEDSMPIMFNRIIILEKNSFYKDTIASNRGTYLYEYNSKNINSTKFIFGLGSGVYIAQKKLTDLIKEPVVYQKSGNFIFDSITHEVYDSKLNEVYDKYLKIIEEWNKNIKMQKKDLN